MRRKGKNVTRKYEQKEEWKIILTVGASSLLSPQGRLGWSYIDGREWPWLSLPCNVLNFSMSFCPVPRLHQDLKFRGLEKTSYYISSVISLYICTVCIFLSHIIILSLYIILSNQILIMKSQLEKLNYLIFDTFKVTIIFQS